MYSNNIFVNAQSTKPVKLTFLYHFYSFIKHLKWFTEQVNMHICGSKPVCPEETLVDKASSTQEGPTFFLRTLLLYDSANHVIWFFF